MSFEVIYVIDHFIIWYKKSFKTSTVRSSKYLLLMLCGSTHNEFRSIINAVPLYFCLSFFEMPPFTVCYTLTWHHWSVCFQEEVMTMERILLQTIKFDLQVEHPYGILLKFAKVLKGNLNTLCGIWLKVKFTTKHGMGWLMFVFSTGDKEKIQKLVQMAWTFINDR